MFPIHAILAPTDLSAHSEPALRGACELACRFGATLHLLHVLPEIVPIGPDPSTMPLPMPPEYYRETEERTFEALRDVIPEDCPRPQSLVLQCRWGDPVDGILAYAQEQQIDLLVVATHGRTGLSHLLIGSFAERIVREAPCPVLTIRESGEHDEGEPSP